jgi:hypothetical protein
LSAFARRFLAIASALTRSSPAMRRGKGTA